VTDRRVTDLDVSASKPSVTAVGGFVPPPYPYDRLDPMRKAAAAYEGGAIDLSIGTPSDAPPPAALSALANSGTERGYPPSIGSTTLRQAACGWMARRFGVTVYPEQVASCMGTKEFVAQSAGWLKLRDPRRDTVLYPAVSYPTYAMGATLAGCRAVAVPVDTQWRLDLTQVDPADVARALCLWVNTPANPTGALDDLAAVAAWGRSHGVPVLSDECYIEFTWRGPPRTILESGCDGVLALHSLSKRSNLAGLRVGFYAGDPELVSYLREVRKHAGFMVAGPVQAAASAALDDDGHVDVQRRQYQHRLRVVADAFGLLGTEVVLPDGTFYLWFSAPGGDSWAFAASLAERYGVLVAPGDLYGPAGAGYVRAAMVIGDAATEAIVRRFGRYSTTGGQPGRNI